MARHVQASSEHICLKHILRNHKVKAGLFQSLLPKAWCWSNAMIVRVGITEQIRIDFSRARTQLQALMHAWPMCYCWICIPNICIKAGCNNRNILGLTGWPVWCPTPHTQKASSRFSERPASREKGSDRAEHQRSSSHLYMHCEYLHRHVHIYASASTHTCSNAHVQCTLTHTHPVYTYPPNTHNTCTYPHTERNCFTNTCFSLTEGHGETSEWKAHWFLQSGYHTSPRILTSVD